MENQKSYNKKNFNYLQFVYIAWIHTYIDFHKIYEQGPYVIDLESEINSLVKDIPSSASSRITNVTIYSLSKEYVILLIVLFMWRITKKINRNASFIRLKFLI